MESEIFIASHVFIIPTRLRNFHSASLLLSSAGVDPRADYFIFSYLLLMPLILRFALHLSHSREPSVPFSRLIKRSLATIAPQTVEFSDFNWHFDQVCLRSESGFCCLLARESSSRKNLARIFRNERLHSAAEEKHSRTRISFSARSPRCQEFRQLRLFCVISNRCH